MNVSVKVDVNIPKYIGKVRSDILWKAAANEWWRLMTPYVPMDSGNLSTNVKIKPKEVDYVSPHAHYQYEGRAMGPSYPIKKNGETVGFYSPKGKRKYYTGKTLVYSKSRHPDASKHWDEKAALSQKSKLNKFIQNYIDSGRLNLNG